jgi:hypothetical protein
MPLAIVQHNHHLFHGICFAWVQVWAVRGTVWAVIRYGL